MMRSGAGHMLARLCLTGVLAVHLGSCGGGTGPKTPMTPTAPAARIELVCPPSLLVGESSACAATFFSATGQVEFVTFTAAWTVTPSAVASITAAARLTGLAAGTATVRVEHSGVSSTASVAVRAEDGLVLTVATTQASGRAGEPATIDFFGWYSVVSADSGTLEVAVRAADGSTISTVRRDVARGGGSFLLQNNFLMPAGAGRACGEASLRISGQLITPTGPVAGPVCIDEARR